MANLVCKTRGESSHRGKQRVYFCAHPDDDKQYFGELAEAIVDAQNCAVWHLDDPDAEVDSAAHLSALADMQLFVIPVTTRLLTTPNRAFDEEFPFAISHHIPVLPILMEEDLSELFNSKCGNLQYLDKNARDTNVKSYTDKLKEHLSVILVGDQVADQVRAAFVAYIFLSYRKKDRQYAQELMRLIHKNDFCRDLAIWYDEYLTLGENFNDEIEDAIKKSGLFTLAVTPNLINEENYVHTNEFPMAKALEKPMLPVEMVATDRTVFGNQYDGVGEVVDGRDAAALADSLSRMLAHVTCQATDDSPEHRYHIGLAYLQGIDVEVDHDRALSLITSAADGGLLDAFDKLVSMYQNGIGVARDYQRAAEWLGKKTALLEESYAEEADEETAALLLVSALSCGDAYETAGNLAATEEFYNKGLAFARQWTAVSQTVSARHGLISALGCVSRILRGQGRLEEADALCGEAGVALDSLEGSMDMIEVRLAAISLYEEQANIEKENGRLPSAESLFRKALSLCEEDVGEGEELVRIIRNRGILCSMLCQTILLDGRLKEARAFGERACEIFRAIAEEQRSELARQDLAVSYSYLGDIYALDSDDATAREQYQKALAVHEEIAAETGKVEARRNIAETCHSVADALRRAGKTTEAEPYHQRARAICEELEAEAKTPQTEHDLQQIYHRMGSLCRDRRMYDEALWFFEKSLAAAQRFTDSETVYAKSVRAISHGMISELCMIKKRPADAKKHLLLALAIDEELVRVTDILENKRSLSVDLEGLGDIVQLEGKRGFFEAEKYYQRALALREEIAARQDTVNAHREISVTHDRLGSLYAANGQSAQARKNYTAALTIVEGLRKRSDTLDVWESIYFCRKRLLELCRREGTFQEARLHGERALAMVKRIAARADERRWWEEAITCYNILGAVCGEQGEKEASREYFHEAVALRRERSTKK